MVSHEICIHIQYFFGVVANKIPNAIYLELIKRRSKVVQEENMACEHALNFDQWKTFSKSYKPMRVWFWLVYKFTKNYCCSWLLWVHWNSKEVYILPLLMKYVSYLENYLSYQALWTKLLCKISHICHCTFNNAFAL